MNFFLSHTFNFAWFLIVLTSANTTFASRSSFDFERRSQIFSQISVPLDWTKPSGKRIKIYYQIFNPDALEKPYLLFIGGGPAHPTINSSYHLRNLRNDFRVVIFDQRGVGLSSPIKLKDQIYDSTDIQKLFGAEAIAQDIQALIKKLLQPDEKFIMAAHSFGSIPLYKYASSPESRLPSHILLLSPAPYGTDAQDFFNHRLNTQIRLHKQVIDARPDLKEKMQKARKKFELLEAQDTFGVVRGNELDSLFIYVDPSSINNLNLQLDRFLSDEVSSPLQLRYLQGQLEFNSSLLYVLDWSWPKRIGQRQLVRDIPPEILQKIEPWMFIESRAILNQNVLDRFTPSERARIEKIDSDLVNSTLEIDTATLSKRTSKIPIVMIAGDSDPLVPLELAKKDFDDLFGQNPLHHFEVVEGGNHSSTLLPIVTDFAKQKMRELDCFYQLSAL